MKVMVIRVFIFLSILIFLLENISAVEVLFTSPEKAKINEEFEVTINTETQETFDVKIYIHNSEDTKITVGEYISETKSDSWKNSWYYIKSAFPDKKLFAVRATDSFGDRTICVKLRNPGSSIVKESCKPILIEPQEISDEQEEVTDDDDESKFEEDSQEAPSNKEEIKEVQELSQPKNTQKEQSSPIVLNSPEEKIEYVSKTSKMRKVALYSFLLLCITIILFMSFKKL